MKKTMLFLLLAAVVMAGCRKNQPFISLTNKNYRLIGTWQLDEIFSVGNIYGTSGSTGSFYRPTVLKLNQDQTASLEGQMLRENADTVRSQAISGRWEAKGETITLHWDGDNVYNERHDVYTLVYASAKQLDISYQNVNSGGGITSDFTHTYRFIK